MEVFKHYIWDKFGQPSIDDFGSIFCKEMLFGENAAKQFMLKLLISYHVLSLRYQYVEMLYKQVLMLGLESTMKKDVAELDELLDTFLTVKENQKLELNDAGLKFVKEALSDEKAANPCVLDIQNHLQDLFTQGDNNEVIANSLNQNIRYKSLRDYICYQVWQRKGRVEGVHPDFGLLSYTRSNNIPSYYHCNDDERVEILLDFSERLSQI